MKNSKLLLGALALTLTLSIGFSIAQNRGDRTEVRQERMEKSKEMRGDRMERIPDLTDEQRSKLKELRLANQKQTLPLKNQLGEKQAKLKTLTTSEKVDMKGVNKLIEEIGGLKIQMAKLKAATHQKVRAELTEEQRLFLDTHAGRGKGHGKGRRMHHGR